MHMRFAGKDYDEEVEETKWPTVAFEEDPASSIAKSRKNKKKKKKAY